MYSVCEVNVHVVCAKVSAENHFKNYDKNDNILWMLGSFTHTICASGTNTFSVTVEGMVNNYLAGAIICF